MPITIAQTKTALAPKNIASFLAEGGVGPYTYAVQPGGAGGSIDGATGLYTAPDSMQLDPSKVFDTIVATDSNLETGTTTIMVGQALLLFCEIIEREMSLDNNHVFLWDQKIFQPTTAGIYVVIGCPSVKPFGNNFRQSPDGSQNEQYISVMATLDINVISRDNSAIFRKEEVLLALASQYSQFQQEGNSFNIGRLPAGDHFKDLSGIDGAAIPYRFQISVNIQYTVAKTKPIDYFDQFETPEVVPNS